MVFWICNLYNNGEVIALFKLYRTVKLLSMIARIRLRTLFARVNQLARGRVVILWICIYAYLILGVGVRCVERNSLKLLVLLSRKEICGVAARRAALFFSPVTDIVQPPVSS